MNVQLPVTTQPKVALVAGDRPMPIVPQNIEQVWRFAQVVAESGMAPKGMEKPEMITVAIMHGLEVGLTPLMALQRIAIINGRPTIWGDAAIALVRASGLCEFVRETIDGDGDAMTARCVVKRRDDTEAVSRDFSVSDAKKASLWDKAGPWKQYPKRMLQMRARAFALRDVFADVLGGLYLREEMDENGSARDVTPIEPPTPPEPPTIVAPVMVDEQMEGAAPEPPPATSPPPAKPDKASGTDALGGKGGTADAHEIPPGLRRSGGGKKQAPTSSTPPFPIDKWLVTLADECKDKTPAQLLNLREKMLDPLRERLGPEGFARAEKVWDDAREVALKKYGVSIDADEWYRNLEGAISGCTSAEQVFAVQEKVQKPAQGKVSPEHYARGKKLVAQALMQLADED